MFVLLLSIAQSPTPDRLIDFDTEVMPVFTRAGCNTGACHGGAAGRGGFKLSLLGTRPGADHESIVRELEGRRVNLADAGDSLLLAKPTGLVDHEGGLRLDPLGEGAERLERWLEEGALRLERRRLVELVVTPPDARTDAVGGTLGLTATARFDDGSERDVTRWTVFSTDSGSLALGDPETGSTEGASAGEVTVLRAGQSLVLARYLDQVVAVRVTTPIGSDEIPLPPGADDDFIDRRIDDLLRALRLAPAPPADAATFLRRARLALTGTLPTPEEVTTFLTDHGPRSRERLIDRLIASPDFVDYWTYRFALMLRVRPVGNDRDVAAAYQAWIRTQLEVGAPYDEMARTLLMAEGDSHEHGQAAFYRVGANAREQAEFVSEAFLGARLRCANCHDHPLDRWTQDDYHGLAAVFARVSNDRVVRVRDTGEVTHPATGAAALPRLPGERFLDPATDTRGELADWLTAETNDAFAKNIVNRVWAALMGRGLVEPLDDLRATNPASHPALLDELARDFVSGGYDLRRTVRLIATSRAFGRSVQRSGPAASDGRYYATATGRPLEAEVLVDAIARVTGVQERFGTEPAGTRAIQLADPTLPSLGLDLLGRCARGGACETGESERGLAATLHLLNGPLLNAKISSRDGYLAEQLASGTKDAALVADLYVRTFSRSPTREEHAFWLDQLAGVRGGRDRKRAYEDFFWSLLSSREFQTNH